MTDSEIRAWVSETYPKLPKKCLNDALEIYRAGYSEGYGIGYTEASDEVKKVRAAPKNRIIFTEGEEVTVAVGGDTVTAQVMERISVDIIKGLFNTWVLVAYFTKDMQYQEQRVLAAFVKKMEVADNA